MAGKVWEPVRKNPRISKESTFAPCAFARDVMGRCTAGSEMGSVACRSARNLSYQDKLPVEGHAEELLQLKGHDLIGVPLKVRTPPPTCSSLLLAALHLINLPLP